MKNFFVVLVFTLEIEGKFICPFQIFFLPSLSAQSRYSGAGACSDRSVIKSFARSVGTLIMVRLQFIYIPKQMGSEQMGPRQVEPGRMVPETSGSQTIGSLIIWGAEGLQPPFGLSIKMRKYHVLALLGLFFTLKFYRLFFILFILKWTKQ